MTRKALKLRKRVDEAMSNSLRSEPEDAVRKNMTQAHRPNLTEGNIYTLGTEEVQILALDADPTCLVWVAYLNDPDRDVMVARTALS
jgi:hypothetical protein